MATPGIFLIVIGNGLECCQDGREEGRRGWRGLDLWVTVGVTFILTEKHMGDKDRYHLILYWAGKCKHTHMPAICW